MTIKVKVTNTNISSSHVISVEAQDIDGEPIEGSDPAELKGGESTEAVVHSGRQLRVREVSQ